MHENIDTVPLFRAADQQEWENLQETGRWNQSINGAQGKGFFYSHEDAQRFGEQQEAMGGAQTVVVQSSVPRRKVEKSPPHRAATEGPGVFIWNGQLSKVVPQVHQKP